MRKRERPPLHPGEILRLHYLEPLDLSLTQVAEALDVSRKTLSKIVNGHAAITPQMALRLGQALHTTPELWLNLQRNFDLWHAARQSDAWQAVSELVKAG